MCREGRLYDVAHWIVEWRPLQLSPEAVRKGTRPSTALEIALRARRWDLVDLPLEWGAEFKSANISAVLDTYNVELYERCRGVGYDLTEGHEMGATFGHGTRNRPLLGFVKRHRAEDPKIQTELNIALGYHVRAGNERGVNLCLWAGADPHAPAPNPELGLSQDADPEDGEEHFIGFSAIEGAPALGISPSSDGWGPIPRVTTSMSCTNMRSTNPSWRSWRRSSRRRI
jgi:hypothetical protein